MPLQKIIFPGSATFLLLFFVLCYSCAHMSTPEREMYYPEPELDGFFYVVKKGDTLTQIAQRYGFDPEELALLNGIENPIPFKRASSSGSNP